MKKLNLRFFLFMSMVVSGIFVKAQTSYMPQIGDAITTDNGKYLVKGNNLITNPNFDDGFNGWTAGDGTTPSESNFSIVNSGGPDGSAYLKALGAAGSSSPLSIKTGWAIEAGKTYLFSCWALRTTSGMSNNTQYSRLFESDTQTATTSQIGTIAYTADTWKQTKVVFTATKSFCVLNLSWLNSASSFDCFFLGEVELSSELVTDKLNSLISNADSIYKASASNEGTGINQFTPEVRTTFFTAINAAKSSLTSATTQTDINTAYTTLNTAITQFYANQNPPFVLGEKYFIIHRGSGLYLTSAGNTGKSISITTNTNQNSQIFTFEKAPDGSNSIGYNIKDADGNYIYRSGSWDAFSGTTTLTDNNAIFNAVKDGDYFQFKNMGSGSVLGTDASKEGSLVYSNKNGMNVPNNDWTIEKYSVTVALDAMISNVENVIATTSVGDAFGQVPQTALDAINVALSKAKAVAPTIKTFDEANAAIAELQTALSAFNASYNQLKEFDTKKIYGISHSSGNVLTLTTSGNAKITDAATDSTSASMQRMTLVSVPCDTLSMLYKIQSTDRDSLYLAISGTYNTVWQTKKDTIAAIFQLVQIDGKYIGLKSMANGKFLGTDGTYSGADLYSDKAGEGNDNAHWNINEFKIKSTLDKSALETMLTKADSLLSKMAQGYKAGQYYLTDINAFSKILTDTKNTSNTATTQTVVDSLSTSITNAITAYKAKAHSSDCAITDYIADLLIVYTAEYNAAVVGTEKGQYSTEVKQAFFDAMETARKGTATEETLQALLTAHNVFLTSANNIDFSALKKMIETANSTILNAVAGDFGGQYPQDAINTYKEAVNNAQAFCDKKAVTQLQVDSTTQVLKTAGTTFASAMVKIDFSILIKTMTAANDSMTNATAEKGTGPGTYPESAFDKLQATVDKGTTINGSKTVNQKYVNNFVDTLLAAIDTFKKARIPNDYSVLDSLISVANNLYNNTPVGSGNGMVSKDMHDYLKESIDKNSTAITTTSQTEIEKSVKLLKRDISLFKQGIVTGIDNEELSDVKIIVENKTIRISNVPSASTIQIYDTTGKQLFHANNKTDMEINLNKGLYIIRILSADKSKIKHLQIK
jgi:hypothetical protein